MSAQQNHAGSRVQDKVHGLSSLAQRSLDRLVPPPLRQRVYDSASALATARPVLFAFVAFQLVFALLPLLLFVIFALSTIVFVIGTALLFAVFWIGVAVLLLVPALAFTSAVALLCFSWGLGIFLVGRWLHGRLAAGATAPPSGLGPAEKQDRGAKGDREEPENGAVNGPHDLY